MLARVRPRIAVGLGIAVGAMAVFMVAAPVHAGVPVQARLAAAGGRIVFQSTRNDGLSQLYAMNADGTDQIQLTDYPDGANRASISRDGHEIAFVRNHQIYTMNADGSDKKQRTFDGINRWPAFSADGKKIVFVRNDPSSTDVYVMNANGTDTTRLTVGALASQPSFSPDGTKIVFTRSVEAVPQIYVMNIDGSHMIALTHTAILAGANTEPSFSPDGKEILFQSLRAGRDTISTMDAQDGSRVTDLSSADAEDEDPAFSPDGTEIVFSSGRPSQLFSMHRDGTHRVQLTSTPTGSNLLPSWGLGSLQLPLTRLVPGRLRALDPAARLGGTTLVSTRSGQAIHTASRRPAFVIGLGPHETIFGGAGHEELGAFGRGAKVLAGKGHDLIIGGTGATLVGGGHDLLVDFKADATIRVDGKGDDVLVAGRHDRVLCAAAARHDVIYEASGESVNPTCKSDRAEILPLTRLRKTAHPGTAATAAAIEGDGSNERPFIAPCADPQHVDCTVSGFKERRLEPPLWRNEYVPSYRCPADHPYLLKRNFAPAGTELPLGVEIQEDWGLPWPIGVSISEVSRVKLKDGSFRARGTSTGLHFSSATLWDINAHWYRVILHCTSDPNHGWR